MTPHAQLIAIIDAARERAGLTSDLQLDDALHTRSQVCRWRKGSGLPGKDKAVMLAELSGRSPREVLDLVGLLEAERSNQMRAAAIYRDALKALAATAAVLLLAPHMPENTMLFLGLTSTGLGANTGYYGYFFLVLLCAIAYRQARRWSTPIGSILGGRAYAA